MLTFCNASAVSRLVVASMRSSRAGEEPALLVAQEPNRDTSQTARSCQIGVGEWTDPDSAQTAQQLRPSPHTTR